MLYVICQDALEREIAQLGVYKPSIAILAAKGRVTPLKVTGVRTPAANIIKQEMLAAGGDCATPGTTITCAVPRVDIILLGGRKQYDILLYKLKQMPYFGIPDIVRELEGYLGRQPKCTVLADGRRLTYEQMAVMGIINVTPDSFYAGSRRRDGRRPRPGGTDARRRGGRPGYRRRIDPARFRPRHGGRGTAPRAACRGSRQTAFPRGRRIR